MADVVHVTNCETGQTSVWPMTLAEIARRDAEAGVDAARRAAEEAREADRAAALEQLKESAKSNPDLLLIARLVGIDVSSDA